MVIGLVRRKHNFANSLTLSSSVNLLPTSVDASSITALDMV